MDAFVSADGPNLVWLNQNSLFSSSGLALGIAFSEDVALGDLDGNGTIDAFVANWGSPNKVWLNLSDPQADLAVQASGSLAIDTTSNGSIDQKVTLTNQGPVEAFNVSLLLNTGGSIALFSGNSSYCTFPSGYGQICLYPSSNNAAIEMIGVSYDVNAHVGPQQTFQHSVINEFSVSSNTPDPNPDNNSATVQTDVYNCEIIGCALEELYCEKSFYPASTSQASFGLVTQAISVTEVAFNLPPYYRVRDEILAGSSNGQHLTNLYYTHSPKIITLVLSNTTVMSQALQTIQIWEPNLEALVEGQGDSAIITAAHIQTMDDFLQTLSALGSPALQAAIAEERASLPDMSTFVGMSMAQARGSVVGFGVYLPVILK